MFVPVFDNICKDNIFFTLAKFMKIFTTHNFLEHSCNIVQRVFFLNGRLSYSIPFCQMSKTLLRIVFESCAVPVNQILDYHGLVWIWIL